MNYVIAAELVASQCVRSGRSQLIDTIDENYWVESSRGGAPELAIRIYTLGRFGVVIANRLPAFARKLPKKPFQVLKVIIALGGRMIDIDTVMEIVWPELGRAARPALDVALMRLRKLLGSQTVVTLSNGALTLNERECWVDVWTFERAVAQFDTGTHRHYRQIFFNLYRGRFLDRDGDLRCIVRVRDRLAAKFRRIALDMARTDEQSLHWHAAAQIYRRCLEHDNLVEEFYSRLMYCEWRLGRCGDAVSTYRRCRDLLHLHLGAKPSSELTALYRRVLAAEPEVTVPKNVFDPLEVG
jgi:DNA-binding SARP family transcriptional activator